MAIKIKDAAPKEYPMTAYVTHLKDGAIRFYPVKYHQWGRSMRCDSHVAYEQGWPTSGNTYPQDFIGQVEEGQYYTQDFDRHEFYIVTTDPDPAQARALVIKALREKADRINTAWNAMLEQAAKLEIHQ